ncbi:hypothetical protein RKD56_004238 [Priestia megaterium]|jgi:hypothetical protein
MNITSINWGDIVWQIFNLVVLFGVGVFIFNFMKKLKKN